MPEVTDAKVNTSAAKAQATAMSEPAVGKSETPAVLKIPAKPKRAAAAKRAPAQAKPQPTKKAAKVGKAVNSSKTVARITKAKPKAATKTKAATKISAARKPTINPSLKEKIMPKNAKIAENTQTVVSDARAKAKKAVEQGNVLFNDASKFTKGNVDAVVASGKVLSDGVQAISKEFVSQGRGAVEMVSGEVKELAAVRSPSELFKVQGDIARKNLDTAITLGTKNSEAMLKLASDVFAPISGRFSMAAEKVRKLSA